MRKINVWKCGTCHKLLLLGAIKDRFENLTCIHAYILPIKNNRHYPFTKMKTIEL